MPDEILAIPNPLRLASGVESPLEVGGQVTYPGLPQGSYPAEFIIDPLITWEVQPEQRLTKNGGTVNGSPVIGLRRIPKLQPFWSNGGYAQIRPFHQGVHIGILDQLNRFYGYFAYSNANDGGLGWYFYVIVQGVAVIGNPNGIPTSPGTNMAVRGDGNTLIYERQASGIWRTEYFWSIAAEVVDFRTYYVLYDPGTAMVRAQQRVDEAVIPLTTSNLTVEQVPAGSMEVRSIDFGHFGVKANSVGDRILRLSHPEIPLPLNVNVLVSPLYLRPIPPTAIAIEGQVIQFESNGGLGGIFEASGGTILSGLRWQAPFGAAVINFQYTIGVVTAQYSLEVVRKLEVAGVDDDGFYPDLAQGERVELQATCPGAHFRSITHPYIINPRGVVIVPYEGDDEVFGEKVVTIRVTGCGQTYNFKIRVQPMFPIPKFCGPEPHKWLQREPDFMPVSTTMTGGTSQVKNRNRDGIFEWEVSYVNLIEKLTEHCTCNEISPSGHLPGCLSKQATAERLSQFYRQVTTVEYFTLVDYHTDIVYKYTRLKEFQRNHTVYRNEQSRDLKMRWEGIPLRAIPDEFIEQQGEGLSPDRPSAETDFPPGTWLFGDQPALLDDRYLYQE